MSEPAEQPGTPSSPAAGPLSTDAGPHYGPVLRHGRPPAGAGGPAGAAGTPPAPTGRSGPDAWAPVAARGWPPSTYAPWPPSAAPDPWGPAQAGQATAGWSAPQRQDYASWSRRVAGAVVDAVPGWVAAVVLLAGYLPVYRGLFRGDLTVAPNHPLVLIGTLLDVAALGWAVYNRWFLAGRTGQSVGKRVTRTWLVSQATGRPVGAFDAFLRDLLHVLDGLGYVGYLWPLWDDERQTLADKIAQTVVVRTPVPPLSGLERRPG